MKAGKYCFKDLFVNRYVEKIIVPEIQRDYVWGEDQIEGLFSSLIDDFVGFKNGSVPEINTKEAADVLAFEEFYKKRKYASNIGFIYAYNDAEYPGKYFLIDGQQRVTTIFLMLAVLTNRNTKLGEEFLRNYCLEGSPKLGYKVRVSSNEFLNKFIAHVITSKDKVDDQQWFLNAYQQDLTCKNLLANYNYIQSHLDNQIDLNEIDFFQYLQNLTEFWYFDTNVSEQGEELYIYMNARGEQMQSNENIKADLLSKLGSKEEKNEYGRKWEVWQDFFWRHREENQTADKGFNEFLCCVAGLEQYLSDKSYVFYSKEDFDGIGGIKTQDVLSYLTLDIIEEYIEVFKYLVDAAKGFVASRNYAEWVSKALDLFWEMFNGNQTNWFANFKDENRATERNRMVYCWSVLLFLKKRNESVLQRLESFRLLRIYYLRYHNNVRSVTNIKLETNHQALNGIWKESVNPENDSEKEETYKASLLKNCHPEDVIALEELVWEIEDHKFNLRGRDVGGTNLSHLIEDSFEVTIESLSTLKDKFYEVFPLNSNSHHKIQHILLYYGSYWHYESPYYYANLKFDNWRRIIRGNGYSEKNTSGKLAFITFFTDFLQYQGSLDDFIIKKNDQFTDVESFASQREKLLWYSRMLNEKMWSQGNSIALRDWDGKDDIFSDINKVVNTKGNYKGGRPQVLAELLTEETKTEFLKKKYAK